jgi:hypothetical protein
VIYGAYLSAAGSPASPVNGDTTLRTRGRGKSVGDIDMRRLPGLPAQRPAEDFAPDGMLVGPDLAGKFVIMDQIDAFSANSERLERGPQRASIGHGVARTIQHQRS